MQLADFLVLLSTDPDALTAFISDPDQAMRRSELAEADRLALQAGAAPSIYRRIAEADAAPPASPDRPAR